MSTLALKERESNKNLVRLELAPVPRPEAKTIELGGRHSEKLREMLEASRRDVSRRSLLQLGKPAEETIARSLVEQRDGARRTLFLSEVTSSETVGDIVLGRRTFLNGLFRLAQAVRLFPNLQLDDLVFGRMREKGLAEESVIPTSFSELARDIRHLGFIKALEDLPYQERLRIGDHGNVCTFIMDTIIRKREDLEKRPSRKETENCSKAESLRLSLWEMVKKEGSIAIPRQIMGLDQIDIAFNLDNILRPIVYEKGIFYYPTEVFCNLELLATMLYVRKLGIVIPEAHLKEIISGYKRIREEHTYEKWCTTYGELCIGSSGSYVRSFKW